jgi:hypothetical protein
MVAMNDPSPNQPINWGVGNVIPDNIVESLLQLGVPEDKVQDLCDKCAGTVKAWETLSQVAFMHYFGIFASVLNSDISKEDLTKLRDQISWLIESFDE